MVVLKSDCEMVRRYGEILAIIRRLFNSNQREGWEDGESVQVVLEDLFEFLQYEDLEAEIFEMAVVPVSKRATGRVIPDLTKIEHVCEFQKKIV